MMRGALAVVLVLAGCDQVFNLTRPPDARVDAPMPVDAPMVQCDLDMPTSVASIPTKGTTLVAGNFDTDNQIDLAVGSTGSPAIMFWFNNNGAFTMMNVDAGGAVLDLAVGRIDGDNRDDVAAITATTASAHLQTASATWDQRSIGVGDDPPRSIDIGDFDGTGLADLLITIPASQVIQRFFGGATAYSSMNGTTPSAGTAVAATVVDLDGDGNRDVVIALDDANAIQRIVASTVDFTPDASALPTGGARPVAIGAARFGDRMVPDVVVANHDSANLTMFRNDGTGALGSSMMIDVAEGPRALAIADLDGDSFADILLVANTANRLQVVPGTATGFDAVRTYTTVLRPTDLAVADFTGDGRLDVAVLGETDGVVIHPTACRPL